MRDFVGRLQVWGGGDGLSWGISPLPSDCVYCHLCGGREVLKMRVTFAITFTVGQVYLTTMILPISLFVPTHIRLPIMT